MPSPLQELHTRLDELEADVTFVALASWLRPRIGAVVMWKGNNEVVQHVRQFMNAKSSRPEGVYGPLLIRLLAALERYLRKLIEDAVNGRAEAALTYDELSLAFRGRNVALTGRVLAAIEAPRDFPVWDFGLLIDNLASCRDSGRPFRLNAQAFSATVTGASPSAIERALDNVDVIDLWDAVGRNQALAEVLSTKGPRATGGRASERLKELWKWRNHLAHGGDEEVALSELQLREIITFIARFCDALDEAVKAQLETNRDSA